MARDGSIEHWRLYRNNAAESSLAIAIQDILIQHDPGIEGIAQAITDETDTQHRGRNRQSWWQPHPWSLLKDIGRRGGIKVVQIVRREPFQPFDAMVRVEASSRVVQYQRHVRVLLAVGADSVLAGRVGQTAGALHMQCY